jgi:uncharacterized protein YjaG (DUF416 family)
MTRRSSGHKVGSNSVTDKWQEDELMEALMGLPRNHKIAFAASCAERLAPAYDLFASINSIEEREVLHNALDYAWHLCLTRKSKHRYYSILTILEELLAGMEDAAEDRLESYAADAVACLIYTLRCYCSGSPEYAVFAAQRAYESADALVSERDDIDFTENNSEERILADPIVKRELEKQKADLRFLTQQNNLDAFLLKSMREESKRIGTQFAAALRDIIDRGG